MELKTAADVFILSIDGILSPATVKWYRAHLKGLVARLGDTDIDTITIHHLRAWRKTLTDRTHRYQDDKYHRRQNGPLSPEYIAGSIRAVRRLWTWLQKEGITERNPTHRLEKPRAPAPSRKGITPADRDRMFATVRGNARDYAILRFLASTACRRAGAAGLTIFDLDVEQRSATLHEKGKGGNKKERQVYFGLSTAAALRAWLRARPTTPDTRIFMLSASGVYQVLRRAASKANVDGRWCPHQWRHAAIRGWLNNGMPLSKASQLAGHSSVKVTGDIYGTSNQTELQAALDHYQWTD